MAFRSDSKPGDEQITSDDIRKAIDVSGWFDKIEDIPAPANAILVTYSGFSPAEVIPHVESVRTQAFREWPYPCIGNLMFLELILSKHPYYPEILSRLGNGQTFLDAGCCFGQDLRKLLFDGAPSSTALYGLDIVPAFFELGYKLFRDQEKLHATFIVEDLLKPAKDLPSLDAKIDMISAFNLLHLFRLAEQKTMACRLVRFTKPISGSTILGRQVGAPEAGHYHGLTKDSTVYYHNVETFRQFWEDVGAATGSTWTVDAFLEPVESKMSSQSWAIPDLSWLYFSVIRR